MIGPHSTVTRQNYPPGLENQPYGCGIFYLLEVNRMTRIGKIAFILLVSFSFIVFCPGEAVAQTGRDSLTGKDPLWPFIQGKTIIAEVRFTGLDSEYEKYPDDVGHQVYERDLQTRLREKHAAIEAAEKFEPAKIEKVILLLKEWLTSEGYLKADVAALGKSLAGNRMLLIFSVNRQEPIRVSEIRFTGSRHISNEEFVADIKQRFGGDWQIFDRRRLEYYANKHSRALMFSKGFFEAKIKRVTPRLTRNSYVVTIEVDEGVRYRFGKITIDGAVAFSKKEIISKLGFESGDIADGRKMQATLFDTLKADYENKGYILYGAEFDVDFIKPEAEGLDGTVDIRITIDEGAQFRLDNIQVAGVEKDQVDEIKELLGLGKGEIFARSIFEKGVKKINETGKYYPIDPNRHVDIFTSEKSATVDLLIKLTEVPK
jgi:outer membrane protein insertion porin family